MPKRRNNARAATENLDLRDIQSPSIARVTFSHNVKMKLSGCQYFYRLAAEMMWSRDPVTPYGQTKGEQGNTRTHKQAQFEKIVLYKIINGCHGILCFDAPHHCVYVPIMTWTFT